MILATFNGSTLHMENGLVSCLLKIDHGYLLHDYFGPALPAGEPDSENTAVKRSFTIEHPEISGFWCDELPEVYPQAGQGSFRQEAFSFQTAKGQSIFEFTFLDWQLHNTLLTPQDLPGLHGPGKTVEIILKEPGGLILHLYYGFAENIPGMVRWNRLENQTSEPVYVERMASFHLPADKHYDEILSLSSSHLHEASLCRQPFTSGIHSFSSRMGCSSGMHFPFLALAEKRADFDHGSIIAAQLLYSGNHETICEKDPFISSMQMGIHPWRFHWKVKPGDCFETPQALVVHSSIGMNGFAQAFHSFYLNHILPEQNPKILLNSWESLYYDTTDSNVLRLADLAADAGAERFVLDDGWFRMDNSSSSPIGDWQTSKEKLKEGLDGIGKKIRKMGMEFGLWIEPEAVSENSELFSMHPDWIIKAEGVQPRLGRHEYLLDLGHPAAAEYIKETFDRILAEGNISYIKWDMNRPMTDIQSGTQAHRYILGLYKILKYIKTNYPNLTIEGCASGGMRLDGGMFFYASQNWASDNTDSFDRYQIQSGLALMFPPQILCAHVSAEKNHQTGRITSMSTRFQTARFFHPGYELNLSLLSAEELDEIRRQIQILKKERTWMQSALFAQQEKCWVKMTSDRSKAEVLIFQEHYSSLNARFRQRVLGLKPDSMYTVLPLHLTISGARLAQQGFSFPLVKEDFSVYAFSLIELHE